MWIVLLGAAVVVLGVLWQAFSIAAYVRGVGEGALDAHLTGSFFVHAGQLAIVIGAIWAWWGNWARVGGAVGFLILAVAQLAFLGDTGEQGTGSTVFTASSRSRSCWRRCGISASRAVS